MATTFALEELDDATRDYLLEVRKTEGRGSPGVFAPVKNSYPALGCFFGPVIIATTLLVTMLSDLILHEPDRVALLQTAGLLLGGWMFVGAFRVWASKGSKKVAGHWVYADPLHLYQARGEQVTITPMVDVVEAQYTHNYNNGSYQNSVVKLRLPGKAVASVTIAHESRAESMVVYFNYLAWARGPEGGERAKLPPATLGGLAKYVAKNDNEPLDAEGNVDLGQVELDIDEVPEEPTRAHRAVPNILPYIVMLVAGVACWFVMRQVNIPYRDDAAFEAVTEPAYYMQPGPLRAYLVDSRNTRHREQVQRHLEDFYTRKVIPNIRNGNGDAELKEGMAKLMESLKRADQGIVSIRVRELRSPPGKTDGAEERVKQLQTGIVSRIGDILGQWEPPIQPRAGETFTESQPAIGHQLVDFVLAPEEAKEAHLEVDYEFVPDGGQYQLRWTAAIRTDIEQDPVARREFTETKTYTADAADTAVTEVRELIVRKLLGSGQPGLPGWPGQ